MIELNLCGECFQPVSECDYYCRNCCKSFCCYALDLETEFSEYVFCVQCGHALIFQE